MRILISIILITLVLTGAFAQELVINEVMSANFSVIADEDEDYPDWIEIYNVGNITVNLNDYGLSDDVSDPFKWVFPLVFFSPGEYLLIFASGKDWVGCFLHTNFKIKSGGEPLILTNPSGETIDQIETGYIPTDISRGRQPDGGDEWYFFAEPTPDSSNSTQGYPGIAEEPGFSSSGGIYSAGFVLMLLPPSSEATIRYTVDGSPPSDSSYIYGSPLAIDWTIVIRARAFQPGLLFSDVNTQSYIFYQNNDLPVISLSTDPANLWDEEIGIYVMGNHAFPIHPYFGANFWQDWERPIHLEFFEPEGSLGFSLDAGVKIFGGWSRAYEQKSLAIYLRDKYGYDEINYRIFPQKDIEEFKSIVLRNSGNDWSSTMMRDALMTTLVNDTDIDIQAYLPSILFLNGEYWGIHNIREKQNEEYLASNRGVDPDNIDLLENNANVIEGDADHYNAMIDFIENNDMRVMENYEYVKTQMDVCNFIDYETSQIYFANTDWPGGNIKFWRPCEPDGQWKWLLFDTDFGFGLFSSYTNNTLALATDPNGHFWPNPPWSTFLLRSLFENESFQNDFINHSADLLNVNFQPGRVVEKIEAIAGSIEAEMPAHRNRWGGTTEEWYDEVDVLIDFAVHRADCVRVHIQDYFNLEGMATILLEVEPPGCGAIKINTKIVPEYPWVGVYYQGVPIQITAQPEEKYIFTGWNGIEPSDSGSISVDLSEDITVTALFELGFGDFSSLELSLLPNYPNPFNRFTRLAFHLPKAGDVSLVIYDIQGREVARLVDGFYPAGMYQRAFDGAGLSSGVYFARLKADGFSQTRKLLLMK